MSFFIEKVEPDSTYENEVYTYSVIISNGDSLRIPVTLSKSQLTEFSIEEGLRPKLIRLKGLIYDVEINDGAITNLTKYPTPKYKVVLNNIQIIKSGEILVFSTILGKNLELYDIEIKGDNLSGIDLSKSYEIELGAYLFSLKEITK